MKRKIGQALFLDEQLFDVMKFDLTECEIVDIRQGETFDLGIRIKDTIYINSEELLYDNENDISKEELIESVNFYKRIARKLLDKQN